ncbi:MAG TPA: hypothetical protein VK969_13155 [Acidimicrobiia bacterium]|nr:hypothetical protein [Acidimicrobiia bacterium]
MFSYHRANAVEEERIGRHRSGRGPVTGRRSYARLAELLTALAGRMASLGLREAKGKVRPAGPAY